MEKEQHPLSSQSQQIEPAASTFKRISDLITTAGRSISTVDRKIINDDTKSAPSASLL